LKELYGQVTASSGTNSPFLKNRDAWAITHHGESAILNEETLLSGYTPLVSTYIQNLKLFNASAKTFTVNHTVSWEEYARTIHLILSGFGKGIEVDSKSHSLVGVGHSMGMVATSILTHSSV
jgi:hypothetical protein